MVAWSSIGTMPSEGFLPNQVPLTTEKYRPVLYVFFFFLSSLPGGGGTQLRRYKPTCPPKPSDLAQRFKVPGGRVSLSNLTPASSTSSISSITSLTSGSSSCSFRHPLQRRNPIIPDTVKLPPGISPQAETFGSTQSLLGKQALKSVRRREQPGRRKDSTQSLYIDSPECDLLLHFSSCPPSASSSANSIALTVASPQDRNHDRKPLLCQRRFSDPDIPYVDDDVWCGQRRKRWLSFFCFFLKATSHERHGGVADDSDGQLVGRGSVHNAELDWWESTVDLYLQLNSGD